MNEIELVGLVDRVEKLDSDADVGLFIIEPGSGCPTPRELALANAELERRGVNIRIVVATCTWG